MPGERATILRSADDTIAGWTPAAARLSGYEAPEIVGRSLRVLLPHDPASPDGPVTLQRSDGTQIAVTWEQTPLCDQHGRVIAHTDVLVPIDEAAPAAADAGERAGGDAAFLDALESLPMFPLERGVLRHEGDELERIVAAAPGAFYSCRIAPDGTLSLPHVSAAMEELYGATRAELEAGVSTLDFIHPDDREWLRESVMASARTLSRWQVEYRLQTPRRGIRWVQGSSMPRRESDGGVQWFGFLQDITDRKRMEETQLRSQKLEAVGTLAGGIAHDFNNMLHAIAGNCGLALRTLPAGHPARPLLESASIAGDRASDLVRRLLQFSRPTEPQRAVMQLREVVREVLRLLRATLPARIELREQLGRDDVHVEADATEVHQIILNLATNAAHAIGEASGYLRVALDRVTLAPGDPRLSHRMCSGVFAVLEVGDSGAGMDESTAARIFDPFFTTKQVGEGTGLGLSIVHGIMLRLGGGIAVRSVLGEGATFSLYFPMREPPVQRLAPRLEPPDASERGRVLLVDDEAILVELGAHALASFGYEVVTFTSPREALRAFLAAPDHFDVVITDLAMPDLSGFDLARRLQELRPALPIVMMSGNVSASELSVARQIGLHEVLRKPTSIEQLGRTVRSAMRLARTTAQSR